MQPTPQALPTSTFQKILWQTTPVTNAPDTRFLTFNSEIKYFLN